MFPIMAVTMPMTEDHSRSLEAVSPCRVTEMKLSVIGDICWLAIVCLMTLYFGLLMQNCLACCDRSTGMLFAGPRHLSKPWRRPESAYREGANGCFSACKNFEIFAGLNDATTGRLASIGSPLEGG